MSRSNGFIEGFASDTVEPTETSYHEFDFDAVEAAFSEVTGTPEDAEKFKQVTNWLLDWLLKVDLNDNRALKAIGKRAVAMAWVLEPERFGEKASLRSLSRLLGFTAPNIAPITAEFSRRTGIRNKFQDHDHYHKNPKAHDYTNN